jgi:tRNA(adenine34) deaminase
MKSAAKKKAGKKRWVKNVTTDSTHPQARLFTKDAASIARGMASKKVSPKGIGSGIRMIQYFINRGGKGLSASRKKELEKAKRILQEKLHKDK